jgi:hypothetical protein
MLDQAVGERRIELEDIAVGAQALVPDEVAGILHREEVLARDQGRGIDRTQGRMGQVVQRVDRLLVPAQAVRRDGITERNRLRGGRL